MQSKYRVKIGLTIAGPPPENFTLVDTGVSLECPNSNQAQQLYALIDQIVRDAGRKMGATRREGVNGVPSLGIQK